ncbi:MAG TPA: serine hydrolase [Planctomycetaceae bacterium]|nr:serine hydrolase [Planctomycetaceae bacterium]
MKRHSRSFLAALAIVMGMATAPLGDEPKSPLRFPGRNWDIAAPEQVGLDAAKLKRAEEYALSGGGAGSVIHRGFLVARWGDEQKRFDLKSTTKSLGAMALGVAVLDGKLALDDPAITHHSQFGIPPEANAETGWLNRITLRHLANQTAGFEKPGGYTKLQFEPGTQWAYSDGGPNWLAECVTLAYRRDAAEVMFERVFTPIGITRDDLIWRANSYRPKEIDGIPRREFGSGVSANVNAMARLGYLHLRRGEWNGKRLLPADFVQQAGTTDKAIVGLPVINPEHYAKASNHYGLLWWNNSDGTLADVPRDAYWSWGLFDSLIVVIPSLDLVVARAGQSWKRAGGADHYDVLKPFLGPIVAAVARTNDDLLERKSQPARASDPSLTDKPPYPASRVITGIEWAPVDTIVRQARGSDNWPITWADDDQLYTAYGDGKGFQPLVDVKLSLGFAKISGKADDFRGFNVRTPTLEARGDDVKGRKASGLLMVDGTLYLLARNAGNSQLAWSRDHGQTWTWADWKFTESFGCPTFLNFGRNYAGARDQFVYVYSHDHDSAYQPADRMVLARVPQQRLTEREAYEFHAGNDAEGRPLWTREIAQRAAVFSHAGRCYRSGISYNAGLRRYLWCQTLPGADARFAGGFGIYDAPEPWGPWTTVFHTSNWDVGPGESSSLPTKWMSDDGRTIHLVFSGDDCFSVRRGQLRTELAWRTRRTIAAPEAHQAAAADERFVYAIANTQVARYDRETGRRVAVSTGAAQHLNSGFLADNRLYCAHSNYPQIPEQSEIKVLDLETMQLSTFQDFGNFGGSLTWAVIRDGHWWCNFARYGDDNAQTFLVEFDADWKELRRFTYSAELIRKLGRNSLSGGLWQDGKLLVTGHDDPILFRLCLPANGTVLELTGSESVPFTGQGFALDSQTGGLIGIHRARKQIVFATRADADR